jgi:hypothetical protein
LQKSVERDVELETFFHNRNQNVNRKGDPDLRSYCVGRCAVEGLNYQVLFNPFEEYFHLPTTFKQLRNRQSWEKEIIG